MSDFKSQQLANKVWTLAIPSKIMHPHSSMKWHTKLGQDQLNSTADAKRLPNILLQ